jgi:hypothetical protein
VAFAAGLAAKFSAESTTSPAAVKRAARYLASMESEHQADDLVGRVADEKLLEADAALLPSAVGRPDPMPEVPARRAIVAAGASMTGLTLVGGIALIVLGLVSAFSSGADLLDGVLVALGFALVATHWGWVHVAELTANSVQARSGRPALERRGQWLRAIAPYPYHEVVTEVEDDGSITLMRVCYRPVATTTGRFAFTREIELREEHSADEPAAAVTERAERLRREAAQATERERQRFLSAADREESERMRAQDMRELYDARRAASRALSEQINANLRNPPLDPGE